MPDSFHKNVSVDSIFFFANVTIVSVERILSRRYFNLCHRKHLLV